MTGGECFDEFLAHCHVASGWPVGRLAIIGVGFVVLFVVGRRRGRSVDSVPGDGWHYDGDVWRHCGRPSFYDDDDDEQVCAKCQASFGWDS